MDSRLMWRQAGNSDDGMPIVAENGPGYGLNLAPGGALNVGGGLPLCVPTVVESQLIGTASVPPTTGLKHVTVTGPGALWGWCLSHIS